MRLRGPRHLWGPRSLSRYLLGGLGFRVEPVEDAGRIVDGPFAEAKELIGGYFVVECDSVDEARERALGNPHRRIGPVVVQPVLPHGA